MELLVLALLVLGGAFAFGFYNSYRGRSKGGTVRSVEPRERATSSDRDDSPQGILNRNLDWLRQRWTAADQERQVGQLKTVPPWFFDEPTERQLDRLKREGVRVTGGKLTKGTASDVIGLFEEPDAEDVEKLRFFKVPTKDLNQSRARHELARLMADPESKAAWDKRPPDAMLKEEMRHWGLSVPRAASHDECARLLQDRFRELSEKEPERAEALDAQWACYEYVWEDLSDRENREMYEIKKPTFSLVKEGVDALHSAGTRWEDIQPEDVAEKLKELKPEVATGT